MWLAILAILAWLAPTAHADCTAGSVSTWPEAGATVAPDQQVLIQATGSHRAWLEGIGEGAALVREGQRVALVPVARHRGSFDMTQVVLEPSQTLPAGGAPWRLQVADEELARSLFEVTWTVRDGLPAGEPVWSGTPMVTATNRAEFGCGPAVEVTVEVPVDGARWIEATVWALGSDERSTVRVPVTDHHIGLGHGMCSGAFALEQGREYFADLAAVGRDGRTVRADDQPLRFTAP